jgi:type VI secretion system protein ImpA
MPLRDEILRPIPGANPAGENLRNTPPYDKIKEARRHEDDIPQGDWQRERKVADWPLTIKLATEALSKKSKDLQLAAWLTEAMLRREGIGGLKEGLGILQGLVETFWENLYPELEDGDTEFRAAPLLWVGETFENAVKSAPLARKGFNFYQYKESRAVGYEQDAADNEAKMATRQAAIADRKLTAEQFDEAFTASPKAWYVELEANCDGVLEAIGTLSEACDSRFGKDSPSFGKLRQAVEEFQQSVHLLLQKKRELEPDPIEQPDAPAHEAVASLALSGPAAAAAAPARAPGPRSAAGDPGDREDAVAWLVAAARYLRRQEPSSPAPYLMLRGLRWGELRTNGGSVDPLLLEAPPTEVRQNLKRLSLQANWATLLEAAEMAMGMPYGRGWLDIQRHVCRACAELGPAYSAIAGAVKSEVRALLHDLPGLPQMELLDESVAASAETLAWLRGLGSLPQLDEVPSENRVPPPRGDSGPDIFKMALGAVAAGRPQEGLEMLTRELARERSGRGRFQRKVQMAQLCLSIERAAIALPLLNDVAAEIEQRKLEEWESSDTVAHALALLYRCLDKLEGSAEDKQRLYERICRLDPAQAMSCT